MRCSQGGVAYAALVEVDLGVEADRVEEARAHDLPRRDELGLAEGRAHLRCERCMGGAGRCMGGAWEVHGRCMGGAWEGHRLGTCGCSRET